ncbi:MAG: HEAT repeat domain-containing protein [Methanotrichaceae archaeon]
MYALVSLEEIHKRAIANKAKIRLKAVKLLRDNFTSIEDKQTAWLYLIKLAQDRNWDVQESALNVLEEAFSLVPDKQAAWLGLHKLIRSKSSYVRMKAVETLGIAIPLIPDRKTVWLDMHRLTHDEEVEVQEIAIDILGANFSLIPDKETTWLDLIWLAQDDDWDIHGSAIAALGKALPHIPDKQTAWLDLLLLAYDKDSHVRSKAIYTMGDAFLLIPDKQTAWLDLSKLAKDKDRDVRSSALYALGQAFPHIPDKQIAWLDLDRLTQDKDSEVRKYAAFALDRAFPHIPDKHIAWLDLHRLSHDEDSEVRGWAAVALGFVFSLIPDKQTALLDLHRLTYNGESGVRQRVAFALGRTFPYTADKQTIWLDLHRMAQDGNSSVKREAAYALGQIFSLTSEKKAVWLDLQKLAQDEDSDVRGHAAYALGRASIFKATEAESIDQFRDQIEKAIEFFDKSSKESKYKSPAEFCLPFYRSLHSLIFITRSDEAEIQRYLKDARAAVEESESKEKLLEAVENLSKALKEVRSYTVDDIINSRHKFRTYAKYCFQAADCVREVRESAPFASKIIDTIMIERSIPTLDDKIKTLFKEVEEAAESFYRGSEGTAQEEMGRSTYELAKGLKSIDSLINAEIYFDKQIIPVLKITCKLLPETSQDYYNKVIGFNKFDGLEQKLEATRDIMQAARVQIENERSRNKEQEEIMTYLRELTSSYSKLSFQSGSTKQNLSWLQNDINKLRGKIEVQDKNLKESLAKLDITLDKMDQNNAKRLEKMRDNLLQYSIKILDSSNSSDEQSKMILKDLHDRRRLNARDITSILADIIQIGSYLNWIILTIYSKLPS